MEHKSNIVFDFSSLSNEELLDCCGFETTNNDQALKKEFLRRFNYIKKMLAMLKSIEACEDIDVERIRDLITKAEKFTV